MIPVRTSAGIIENKKKIDDTKTKAPKLTKPILPIFDICTNSGPSKAMEPTIKGNAYVSRTPKDVRLPKTGEE
jgi:hypothetical protein